MIDGELIGRLGGIAAARGCSLEEAVSQAIRIGIQQLESWAQVESVGRVGMQEMWSSAGAGASLPGAAWSANLGGCGIPEKSRDEIRNQIQGTREKLG